MTAWTFYRLDIWLLGHCATRNLVKWSNGQMSKWSNVQMVKCPNGQMSKRSKCPSGQISKWSNVQMVKCPNGQISKWSNVQKTKCLKCPKVKMSQNQNVSAQISKRLVAWEKSPECTPGGMELPKMVMMVEVPPHRDEVWAIRFGSRRPPGTGMGPFWNLGFSGSFFLVIFKWP